MDSTTGPPCLNLRAPRHRTGQNMTQERSVERPRRSPAEHP